MAAFLERTPSRFELMTRSFWDVAEIGFIDLNDFAFAAHRGKIKTATTHRFHNAMM